MGGKLEISKSEAGARAELQTGTIAVVPGRRGMCLDLAIEFDSGDTPQVFAEDFLLDFQLMVVGGMLVVASSAMAEMRTRWRDAMRRRFYDGRGVGAGEAGLFFGEGGVDFFCGENKRDEDGLAASLVIGRKASEPVAAVDELFDGQEQALILRH